MIYLIWWSPRWGKTTLAKKLSQKLSIPVLSTDFFRLMLLPYFNWKQKEEAFPFEEMYDKVGIESLYTVYSGKELLSADMHESQILWKGIQSFIDFIVSSKKDYIIEWIHLLPELLSMYKDSSKCTILYLTKTDTEKICLWLRSNRGNDDWIADNVTDVWLTDVARVLSTYWVYFEEEARKYDFKFYNTEDDFFEVLDSIVSNITQK